MEALADEIWGCLSRQKRMTAHIERLVCAGGLSQSRLYNQILADTCNIPLEVMIQKEATTMGALMSVLVNLGYQRDMESAAKAMAQGSSRYEPNPKRHERYMEIHYRRQELLNSILNAERRI